MAFLLNTLHIFGYGEAQVIGRDGNTNINKKAPISELTKVTPVVDDVYSFKPADNQATNSYHVINLFKNVFADYQPKDKFKSWRVDWSKLNESAIDDLVAEVLAYTPPAKP